MLLISLSLLLLLLAVISIRIIICWFGVRIPAGAPIHWPVFDTPGLAESQAASVKHMVIKPEKATGMMKRYLQLTTVMTAKQRANAQAVARMSARVAAGRPPSCHANLAANR